VLRVSFDIGWVHDEASRSRRTQAENLETVTDEVRSQVPGGGNAFIKIQMWHSALSSMQGSAAEGRRFVPDWGWRGRKILASQMVKSGGDLGKPYH